MSPGPSPTFLAPFYPDPDPEMPATTYVATTYMCMYLGTCSTTCMQYLNFSTYSEFIEGAPTKGRTDAGREDPEVVKDAALDQEDSEEG
jgi:hypothetical protein